MTFVKSVFLCFFALLASGSAIALEPDFYTGRLGWKRVADVTAHTDIDIYFRSKGQCRKWSETGFSTPEQFFRELRLNSEKDIAKVSLSKLLRAQYSDQELTEYAATAIVKPLQDIGYKRVLLFACHGGGLIVLSDTAESEENENPNTPGSVSRALQALAVEDAEKLKKDLSEEDLSIVVSNNSKITIKSKNDDSYGVKWSYKPGAPEEPDDLWKDDYKIEKALFGNELKAIRIRTLVNNVPVGRVISSSVKF